MNIPYYQFVEHVALPLSDRFTASNFWRLSKHVDRHSRLPIELIKSTQDESLKKLFDVARRKTEFWKERLRSIGTNEHVREQLKQVSPVSKRELEAGFPDQVVNRFVDQSELRFAATRGTTQRMICVHDFAKREAMRAAMICTLRASGYRVGMPIVEIPPNVCDTVCGELKEQDDCVLPHFRRMLFERTISHPPAWRNLRGKIERNWVYRKKTYSPFSPEHGTSQPTELLDHYIDRLSVDRPHTLKGLTTYLFQIAKRALQRRDIQLKIPVVRPLGSGVTLSMTNTIEKAFNARFYNDYGTAELGPIAFACPAGHGMHIFANHFIVEIVDPAGNEVGGGTLGELLITDLINHAMPLIRYRVGDLGRLNVAPCECGSALPRLHVEGRTQDSFWLKNVGWISSEQIANALYSLRWLDQFQLVQKPNGHLELKVVAKNDTEFEIAEAQRILKTLLGQEQQIKIRSAQTILPENGGKFRWVKILGDSPQLDR